MTISPKLYSGLLGIGLLATAACSSSDAGIDQQADDPAVKHAREFLVNLAGGDVDGCYRQLGPELQNESTRQFLDSLSTAWRNSLDSVTLVGQSTTTVVGSGTVQHSLTFESRVRKEWAYLTFSILEAPTILGISGFHYQVLPQSLSDLHAFRLSGKGILHHLMLIMAMAVPLFILTTLIVILRSRIRRKGLWIFLVLIGLGKLSLDWTSGEIGYRLINFSLFGAGMTRDSHLAPWIIYFSIPAGAIVYWLNRKQLVDPSSNQQTS